MDMNEFDKLLHREPFVPFRISLTNGQVYEIQNPSLVVPMKRDVFIAMSGREDWVLIPIIHIASVESIQAA
ncbi:MAG: hypothetical protein HJJLKODD_01269 [Phycisphaerae bacterium]|nr:hypothetical protein [Phycisphaerae bacterium]